MYRRYLAGALCAAMCMMLCSCSKAPYASEAAPEITLPEPSAAPEKMILGEQILSEPVQATLYYVSGDANSFTTVTRNIVIAEEENIYEETVRALLNTSGVPERTALMPQGTQLLDVEYACGVVTVDLSLDVHAAENEQEYLMMAASIVNTLLSLQDVKGVNILVNGRSEGLASMPVGVQTVPYTGITPAYAQISAERDYFLMSETGTVVREAALYFPTQEDNWLVPEIRSITFDSSNYAAGLIRALRSGPEQFSNAVSAIPEGADLLVQNPVVEINSAGERILRLDFAPTILSYLAFSGIDEWKLIGSAVLTVTSFVPGIDGVRIYIDDRMLTSYAIDGREVDLREGVIRRSDFDAYIGDVYRLYLPNKDGTLDAVERADTMLRARSPQSRLQVLFDHAVENSDGTGAFPTDVYYDDILGVALSDGVATVNLSSNFYRQAQALDAASERGVVYAIVNTLCEMDRINGVRFCIEGMTAETLSGSIYLKDVLLPNPGVVAYAHEAVPEFTAIP